MKKRVNFFVIGQPKCGTTSLFHYFKKHDNFFLPKQKQLYFFADEHNKYRKQFKELNSKHYKRYYNYDFEDYISRFDFTTNCKIYADITPDYVYSKNTSQRIYKYNPEAKIILILREPLSFLKSFHNQLVQSGREDEKNFYKAMSYQEKRRTKPFKQDIQTPPIYFQYSDLINYIGFVKEFYKLFKTNFKIIVYEEFKQNNKKTLEDICSFLEIDNFKSIKKINSNASLRGFSNFNRIKKHKIIRFISEKTPWKLKYWIKEKPVKYFFKSNKKNNTDSDFDINFKKNINKKTKELKKYIIEKDLYLTNKKNTLIEKWKNV